MEDRTIGYAQKDKKTSNGMSREREMRQYIKNPLTVTVRRKHSEVWGMQKPSVYWIVVNKKKKTR